MTAREIDLELRTSGSADSDPRGAPEPADEAVELKAKALDRVRNWWPRGIERTSPEPEAVAFARRHVAAHGPRDPNEAGQMLAFCHNYARWRLDQGLALTNDCFSNVQIEDYLADALAGVTKGTTSPARMYLRRLNRLKPPQQTRPAPAAPTRAGKPRPGTVLEAIDTYKPENVDLGRFERVADLVREGVRIFAPLTEKRATSAMCWATYLAAWCDAQARPLRPDVVFHPDTVEEFMAARLANGSDERTVAAEGSLLRDLARAVNPGLRAHRRVVIAKPDTDSPYTHDEIDSLLASARSLNTPLRRRYANAVIALGLAVGPFGGEYPRVEPGHITIVDGELHAALRRNAETQARTVVALPAYAGLLKDALGAALDADDRYLIGGLRPTANRLSKILEDFDASTWTVPLDAARLRTTYLTELANQPHPLREFLTLSGLATLNGFERILRHVGTLDDDRDPGT